MLELIKPVLLTYATRRSMQWVVGLGGLIYALVIFAMAMDPPSAHRIQSGFFSLGFPTGVVAYLLVSQAKWQFVDPRARLLTQFARPHLAVLFALAVVGLLFMPCLAAIAARLSVVGYLACTIGLASSFIWAMHANSGSGSLLTMMIYFSMMSERVSNFWLLPESVEQLFPLHLAILLAGWGVLVAWLVRLSRMTEESDDYNIPIQAQSGSATRMERSQANRNLLRNKLSNGLWKGGPADWWHDKLAGCQARSTSERQRLFRYGFTPVPFELSMCWMAASMAVGAIGVNQLVVRDSNSVNMGLFAPLMLMPVMISGQLLAVRRARMPQELLLPLSRERYIDGLLVQMARSTIASLIIFALLGLALVAATPFVYLSTPTVLAAAALVAAMQPHFFGVNVYAALWTSAAARIGVMIVGLLPVMLASGVGMALLKFHGIVWPLVIAAGMLLLGVAVIVKARRKWLNAELAT